MKKILLWILAFLFIVSLAAYLFLSNISSDFMIRRIAEITQNATGAPLKLETAPTISVFPPSASLGASSWKGEAGGCAVSVSIKGGMVWLELMPLLFGNIVLSQIMLDQPEASISPLLDSESRPSQSKASSSKGSRATDVVSRAETHSGQTQPVRKAPDDALPLELGRLTVKKGALLLESGQEKIRITGFNLSLENLRRREEVSIEGDLVLELLKANAGQKDSKPLLAGNLAFKGALRYYAPNLTFRKTSLAFSPLQGAIPRLLSPLQLTGEGALDLASLNFRLAKARLAAPQARLNFQGQGGLVPFSLTGEAQLDGSAHKMAALAGIALAEASPDAVDIRTRLDFSQAVLKLADLGGEAAGTKLGGELSLALPPSSATPLALRGALRFGSVALDAWGTSENSQAENQKRTLQSSAAKDKNDWPTPAAKDFESNFPILDLRLAIAALRFKAFGFQDFSTRLTGQAGRYTASGISARFSGGGTFRGDLTLDMAKNSCTLDSTASGVDLGSLSAAAGKAGLVRGSGSLDLSLRAWGKDKNALLSSLEGQGQLEARDLSFPALREATFLRDLLSLVQFRLPERIETASAPFTAHKGEITASPITLTGNGLAARGEARASLARQFLQGSATVTVNGLNIPLLFQGPFDDLNVSVEPKFMLELGRKLGKLPNAAEAVKDAARTKSPALIRDGLDAAGDLARQILGR